MKTKLIIIYSIFALIIVPIYFIHKYSSINITPTYYSYSYKYNENNIEFYKNDELINTYTCNTDCYIHSINTVNYFNEEEHKTIIKDGQYVFTYDFLNGNIIGEQSIHTPHNYTYIKAFDEVLLTVEENNLNIIDYKENTLTNICEIESTSPVNATLEDNILKVETEGQKYIIDLTNIAS